MLGGKAHIVNSQGLDNLLLNPSDYTSIYGGSINAFFKPFTTYTAATGVSRYTLGTGFFLNGRVSAYGLNPFGDLGYGCTYW
jgi:hypothetical protein